MRHRPYFFETCNPRTAVGNVWRSHALQRTTDALQLIANEVKLLRILEQHKQSSSTNGQPPPPPTPPPPVRTESETTVGPASTAPSTPASTPSSAPSSASTPRRVLNLDDMKSQPLPPPGSARGRSLDPTTPRERMEASRAQRREARGETTLKENLRVAIRDLNVASFERKEREGSSSSSSWSSSSSSSWSSSSPSSSSSSSSSDSSSPSSPSFPPTRPPLQASDREQELIREIQQLRQELAEARRNPPAASVQQPAAAGGGGPSAAAGGGVGDDEKKANVNRLFLDYSQKLQLMKEEESKPPESRDPASLQNAKKARVDAAFELKMALLELDTIQTRVNDSQMTLFERAVGIMSGMISSPNFGDFYASQESALQEAGIFVYTTAQVSELASNQYLMGDLSDAILDQMLQILDEGWGPTQATEFIRKKSGRIAPVQTQGPRRRVSVTGQESVQARTDNNRNLYNEWIRVFQILYRIADTYRDKDSENTLLPKIGAQSGEFDILKSTIAKWKREPELYRALISDADNVKGSNPNVFKPGAPQWNEIEMRALAYLLSQKFATDHFTDIDRVKSQIDTFLNEIKENDSRRWAENYSVAKIKDLILRIPGIPGIDLNALPGSVQTVASGLGKKTNAAEDMRREPQQQPAAGPSSAASTSSAAGTLQPPVIAGGGAPPPPAPPPKINSSFARDLFLGLTFPVRTVRRAVM